MKTVLFVCTGNLCRSPMAEGLLEKMLREKGAENTEVLSAGTNPPDGTPPIEEAIKVVRKGGIDISGHRAVQIGRDLIVNADLILTMGSRHKEKVLELVPAAKDKVFLMKEFAGEGILEIADPIGLSLPGYEKCAAEIREILEKVIPRIIKFCEGDK